MTFSVLALILYLFTPVVSAQTPPLVAEYAFNEGTGAIISDSSGNGNNGTIVNAVWTNSGRFGSALVFDGVGALVTIGDSPSLHLTSGMTLEAWVNPSVVDSTWRDVIYKGADNYYLEATSTTTGGPAGAGTFGANANDVMAAAAQTLPTNAWTHLAVTYDGAILQLYVNGVPISSLPQSGDIATSANPLQIGGDSIFGQYFAGVVDEVRIYGAPLTQGQIQADMNTPIAGTTMGGPVAGLSTAALNFTNQLLGTTSSPQAVNLTNLGGATMILGGVTVSGPAAGDFSETDNCGSSLAASASCTISLSYAPSRTGTESATIVIADNAPGNPHTAALSGTAISQPQLVAAYAFNEGAGTGVADSSGNGNNGTIVNAVWTNSGRFGNALVFDGVGALVTVGDSPSLHLTGGMTLEAWVNPSVVDSTWRDVIYKGADNYYLEAASTTTGGPAGAGTFGANANDVTAAAAQALPTNAWTHLAVTYDGAILQLYVNGVPVSSLAQSGDIATSANPLQIGGDSIFGQYFAGVVDEVRIYSRPLTQGQIQADMNTPIAGTTMGGPVAGLSTAALNFTNQLLGTTSSPQTVTLTNVGGAAMTLGGVKVSGPAAGRFSETDNCGTSLAARASCTISLSYTPGRTGTEAATIVIADDAPGNPHTVALSGAGISSAPLSISPPVATITSTFTQQFTVAGAASALVWSVDGLAGGAAVSGTVTSSGLYQPPNQAGVHVVTASTSDLSQSANATIYVTNSTGSATYLRVGDNGRYLVDQNNLPFMVMGDSAQSIIGNLSESDAALYFADRQAAGFNTVWINLLCNDYTHCNSDGTTFDGIPPFLTDGDLSTPNEDYFKRADDMINLAAQYGLVVFLDPVETGGWLDVLRSNGPAKAFDYGAYVGNRYTSFPNIVWLNGNDFQSWRDAGDDALVLAVARGIRSADLNHIQTVELDFLLSTSLDDSNWAPIVSMNAAYTYYPTYAEVLSAYNQSRAIPTFLIEANYEFEDLANDFGSPAVLRRQEYWTALSGATGQFYGNFYTWRFTDNWQNNLDTPGSVQFGYLKNLFASRKWYNLVPDQGHIIVTDGFGSFVDSGAISDADYAAVGATTDGSLVMAYLPTVRTVTVDMTQLAGPAQAQWYDPANGAYLPISGAPFPNNGPQQFTPPGNNRDGDEDWVLVLESNGPAIAGPQSVSDRVRRR